jgi:hypothetical protein
VRIGCTGPILFLGVLVAGFLCIKGPRSKIVYYSQQKGYCRSTTSLASICKTQEKKAAEKHRGI